MLHQALLLVVGQVMRASYLNCSFMGSYPEDVDVLGRRPWTTDDMTLIERSFGFHGEPSPEWMYRIIVDGEEEWVSDRYITLYTEENK